MSNYRRGGGGGGGGGRDQQGDRINEADVPESKHTVFIRGLPSSITTDEVREFFENKIGACNFDFVKVDPGRGQLYVAVRFENKEAAKECMDKYKDGKLFGFNVELTWFRDIRRYIAYCQKKGIRPRPARENPRFRSGRRRGSVSRSRTRSRSKTKSRSRSPYSYSRSASPRARSRSPSKSRSRTRSASPPHVERYSHSEEEEKRRSPSPPRKKKAKKEKKIKKNKRRSPSRSPTNSDSDIELSDGEANGKHSDKHLHFPKKESPKTSSNNNNNMGRISFSLDLDSKTILQEVRYKQPEIPDSPPTGGALRLRTIQKKSPETIREEKLARLSKELREKVEKKKINLELAYRQDCETFGFVAQNLIQKDKSMEEKIRLALLESMKEMEQGVLKQLDEYIDQLLFVSEK